MKRCLLLITVGLVLAANLSAGTPKTTHIYPHIADLDGVIRTIFLVINQGEGEVTVTLEFFGSDGSPLTLSIDGTTTSSLERVIPAGETLRLATAMTASPIAVGWARLTADAPVGSQAQFEIVSGGNLVTQAAIDSATLSRRLEGFVEISESTATGFGITNPGPGPIVVQITVRNGNDVLGTTQITMGPNTHTSAFLNQTFQSIGNVASASVEFFATGQFALVILQQTGLVLGSLPPIPNESL